MDGLYVKFEEGILDGAVDLLSDTVKAILIDTSFYTVNLATHQFLSDIPAPARVAISDALTGKTTTGGVFNAAQGLFPFATGATAHSVVLYQDTGVEGTSHLIAYLDSYTGLPVAPNGSNIYINWPTDAAKIFKIGA